VSDAINKVIWDQVKTPPPEALKEIKAGRLKGKSDISPQWRYEIMTEIFGPCGIGWKFTINKLWTEQGSERQVFAFAMVTVEYTHNDIVGSVPGIGGAMLVKNESKGPYNDDDAYKKATTDAIGTALKMIGVAADVYAGLCDSKHGDTPQGNQQQPQGNQQQPANNEFGF
jgi:hypothetical protein